VAKTSIITVALLLTGCSAQGGSDVSELDSRPVATSERAEESRESENTAVSSLGNAATVSPGQSESDLAVDSLYDTDRYFEVRDGGSDYICQSRNRLSSLDRQYDCVRYIGGAAPFRWSPVLFCSGQRTMPSCSSNWYPDELELHEFFTINGVTYICRSATLGSWGDSDCYRYMGGDPWMSIGGWVDLYCSGSGYSMSCSADDYPSVWEDYSVFRIGMWDYVCDESAWGDAPCVRYRGGSPSQYSFWNPDYYCPRFGSCYQN